MTKFCFWVCAGLLAVRVLLAAGTPVFDTSEARYAAISANMARTGDFLVPRFTHDHRYQSFDGKPPLLFQLGGLSARVFGVNEFAVRLPVLLASLALLFLLWRCVRTLTDDPKRAWSAVLVATTSVALYAVFGLCMTDGLLVAAVDGAYFSYVLYLQTENRNWSLGLFLALALGMLIKGPVALVLFGIPVFLETCVNRRWRQIARIRWFSGLALFLVVSAPWFVRMAWENPDFLEYFFIHENFLRFVTPDYGDKYGAGREFFRGMALVWIVVVTLPWTPLALFAKRPRFRDTSPVAVFVWGVAGIVGFWCLTSRVPMTYVLPAVPLFAAWIGAKGPTLLVSRLFPPAAVLAVLVVTSALIGGLLTTNKMMGAKAPYRHNRYSYEFYHGTPPAAEMTPSQEKKVPCPL